MRRVVFAALTLVALSLMPVRGVKAQRMLGLAPGFIFDETENFITATISGWFPLSTPSAVVSPRLTVYPGLHLTQADVDLLWDIPIAEDAALRPYLGAGFGVVHSSFDGFTYTKPLLNLDAGLRYKPSDANYQFFFESHYSSGLEYPNTMVLNLGIMFGLPGSSALKTLRR